MVELHQLESWLGTRLSNPTCHHGGKCAEMLASGGDRNLSGVPNEGVVCWGDAMKNWTKCELQFAKSEIFEIQRRSAEKKLNLAQSSSP